MKQARKKYISTIYLYIAYSPQLKQVSTYLFSVYKLNMYYVLGINNY